MELYSKNDFFIKYYIYSTVTGFGANFLVDQHRILSSELYGMIVTGGNDG